MATLLSMRDQVKADLDLEDEDFISDADINTWINEAIEVAESQIHTIYEDYFLVETTITLTEGQNLYDYPTDIYANKIRKIIYRDGAANSTSSHLIRRVKDLLRAKERDYFSNNSTNPVLEWAPINDSTVGKKIRIFPSIARGGFMDMFYIRNAKRLTADTDVTDIDEFSRFLIQYAKTQAYLKDGDLRSDDSKILEEQFKQDMVDTLSDMSPDNDNEVDMDLSHYDDMVGTGYHEYDDWQGNN